MHEIEVPSRVMGCIQMEREGLDDLSLFGRMDGVIDDLRNFESSENWWMVDRNNVPWRVRY